MMYQEEAKKDTGKEYPLGCREVDKDTAPLGLAFLVNLIAPVFGRNHGCCSKNIRKVDEE